MTTRYHIKGALRESGRDTIIVIEAETKEAASRIAMDRGILVSAVTKLPESKAPRQTKDPREPQLRFEVLGIASTVLNIAGVVVVLVGGCLTLLSVRIIASGSSEVTTAGAAANLDVSGIADALIGIGWLMLGASVSIIMAGVVLIAFGGLIEVARTIECNQRKLLSAKEAPP